MEAFARRTHRVWCLEFDGNGEVFTQILTQWTSVYIPLSRPIADSAGQFVRLVDWHSTVEDDVDG